METKNTLFWRRKDNKLKFPLSQEQLDKIREYDSKTGGDSVADQLRYTHSCVREVLYYRGKQPVIEVSLGGSCCGLVPDSLKGIIARCLDQVDDGTIDEVKEEAPRRRGCW